MTWLSHTLIAVSIAGPLCGSLPATAAGATAPDWLEWLIAALFRRRVRHRWTTHFLLVWMGGFLLSLFCAVTVPGPITAAAAWFCFGGLLHVLCDALTISGVPLAPWSLQRFTLAGGRIRTGDPGEFVISASLLVFSLVVGWCSAPGLPGQG